MRWTYKALRTWRARGHGLAERVAPREAGAVGLWLVSAAAYLFACLSFVERHDVRGVYLLVAGFAAVRAATALAQEGKGP